jgi:hypothetical protein
MFSLSLVTYSFSLCSFDLASVRISHVVATTHTETLPDNLYGLQSLTPDPDGALTCFKEVKAMQHISHN